MKAKHVVWLIGLFSLLISCSSKRDTSNDWTWRSLAFDVEISVLCPDLPAEKQAHLAKRLSERTEEIEQLFSLYLDGSTLNTLNQTGHLGNTPEEFTTLINKSVQLGHATNNLFDISVQPLWEWRNSLKQLPATQRSQAETEQLDEVLALIDFQQILTYDNEVHLTRKGMKLTLNGLVQGYLADELSKILAEENVSNALVNAGEYRALGHDGSGQVWQITVQSPRNAKALAKIQLDSGRALAVSAGYGQTFDPAGTTHHLFHPASAKHESPNRTIIVIANDATSADALATAYAVAPAEHWQALYTKHHQTFPAKIEIYQDKEKVFEIGE